MRSTVVWIILGLLGSTALVSAQRQQFRIVDREAVFFRSGSHKVTTQYTKKLRWVAQLLNEAPDRRAWIQAHTDSLGSYESNQALSDRRAQAVYSVLASEGVDSTQLKIDSYGEYIPLKNNRTSDGRAFNRRVSIDVVEPYIPSEIDQRICTILGTVVDAKTRKPLQTRLVFNSLLGRDTIETDSAGRYIYTTFKETNIEVRAYSRGHFFIAKVASTKQGQEVVVNFSLERAVIGGKMALSDLFFQSGTALLMPASEKALQGLAGFMQFNDNLSIEIGGHINKPNQVPVLESSSSFKLSEARAEVIYNYLIEQGIDSKRLTYKGYGNSEMIHPRADNPIQEQMNRRVELTITAE
jgi:outer membrane protein OmpA-like peptidoglycan-associated protein